MIEYLVVVGAVAYVLGNLKYAIDTLQGRTKPNRVSWLMWSIAPLIGSAAAFSAGATWAAVPVFIAGFCSLFILAATFVNKKAYWKLETFDYLCGLFSLLALVLWALTSQPVVAIIFAIISDAFAYIPTQRKAWIHPETESYWVYAASVFNALTGLLVVKTWAFSEYAFPAYLVIINCLLLFSVFGKEIITPKPARGNRK